RGRGARGGGVGAGGGGAPAGSSLGGERGGPQGRRCDLGNRRALRSTRNRPSPPSPPPHARLHPPAVRPSRPCPPPALTAKVSHNLAGEPLRPPRKGRVSEKTARGGFWPHPSAKPVHNAPRT